MRYRFIEPWGAGRHRFNRGDVIESGDVPDRDLADLLSARVIEEFPSVKEHRDRMIHRAPVRK